MVLITDPYPCNLQLIVEVQHRMEAVLVMDPLRRHLNVGNTLFRTTQAVTLKRNKDSYVIWKSLLMLSPVKRTVDLPIISLSFVRLQYPLPYPSFLQSMGVDGTLVPQHVKLARSDEGTRQIGQVGLHHRSKVRIREERSHVVLRKQSFKKLKQIFKITI